MGNQRGHNRQQVAEGICDRIAARLRIFVARSFDGFANALVEQLDGTVDGLAYRPVVFDGECDQTTDRETVAQQTRRAGSHTHVGFGERRTVSRATLALSQTCPLYRGEDRARDLRALGQFLRVEAGLTGLALDGGQQSPVRLARVTGFEER